MSREKLVLGKKYLVGSYCIYSETRAQISDTLVYKNHT